MSAARQMVLDLGWPMAPTMTRAAFVTSESNRAPLAMIDAWESWPSGRLCLTGAADAGKTHLARIWLEAAGGRALRAETAFDPAAG